jgi:hypothetical protein
MKKIKLKFNDHESTGSWHLRVFVLSLVGLILYLSTYPFELWFRADSLLVRFLKEIGIALLISTIIAYLLDKMVHESLLINVDKSIDKIRKGSDILDGSTNLGIEDILARHEPNTRLRWEAKVKKAIENQLNKGSGEILIACVAAPEFFRQDKILGSIMWKGFKELQEKPNSDCRMRALLLCPESEWANLRVELEPGHPTKADIEASFKYLHFLTNVTSNRIQFNCYNFPPIAFLVLTSELLFMEPYPMVKVNLGEGPIGGSSPMIVVRKDTLTYDIWKKHFEFIWEHRSTPFEKHHTIST